MNEQASHSRQSYAKIIKMSQPVRDIERAELPNGLVIVTEKMPYVRSVSVGIWLGTGSRGESPDRFADPWRTRCSS